MNWVLIIALLAADGPMGFDYIDGFSDSVACETAAVKIKAQNPAFTAFCIKRY